MFRDTCQVEKLSFEQILDKFNGVKEFDGYHMAFCPAHENTKTRALSISQKDGKVLLHCFAGCKGEDIAKAAGIPLQSLFLDAPKLQGKPEILTISALAYRKKLPVEFLAKFAREILGVQLKHKYGLGKGKDNWGGLHLVYKDLAGNESTCMQRIRTKLTAKEGTFWSKDLLPDGSKKQVIMFGLWLVPSFTKDYCFLPEGETNALTFWYHDHPAISFPGATMASKLKLEYIAKFNRVYLCYDKDQAGCSLAESTLKQLKKIHYQGQAFVITFPEDCKDVSDLHCNHLETFQDDLQKCIDAAIPLHEFVKQNISKTNEKTASTEPVKDDDTDVIKRIPCNSTSHYEVTAKGVFQCAVEKDFTTDRETKIMKRICADPVYISERLVDIFNSTSQVRLVWGQKECVVPTTCLSGNDMKVLTDLGLRILSTNGAEMGKYFLASLDQLEAESNFASRNGWLNRKYTQFILGQKIFEPDRQDTIARYDDDALDISAQGCRETWLKLVKQYYSNKYIALAMSASAASFLAAPLGVESSILHLYGDSSCGKSTATLFAASLWGQPMMTQDKSIRRNWNSTPVGIELYFQQMFNLCCFLEDSADVKDDETLVRLVQAFVNGAGKNRGTIAKKNGGLTADRTKNWQALLLSTGEKRITDASNMGGVTARTMEVEVTRIETYKQSQFQTMRTTFADNFGFGADLINFWFLHAEQIKKQFNDYLNLLEESFPNASDIKSRCFCALALILTGNFLLSQVFGLDEQPQIITLVEGIMANEEPKGSKGVYESLVEHFMSNRSRFGEMEKLSNGEHTYVASGDKEELGIYHTDMNMVMFHIDKLKLHLNKLKFTTSQVAMLKKEGKLVVTPSEGNRYAQKINGVRVRFYAVKMPKDDN